MQGETACCSANQRDWWRERYDARLKKQFWALFSDALIVFEVEALVVGGKKNKHARGWMLERRGLRIFNTQEQQAPTSKFCIVHYHDY